jgi:type I restriction enzyme R subunit
MPRNEADTRAELIDPRLKTAGWTASQVTREHFYNRDQAYTVDTQIMIIQPNERYLGKRLVYSLYSHRG